MRAGLGARRSFAHGIGQRHQAINEGGLNHPSGLGRVIGRRAGWLNSRLGRAVLHSDTSVGAVVEPVA